MRATVTSYGNRETIFQQGEVADAVLYIHTGGVKLSVRSKGGRHGVVALLGPGEFFGDGCLAGQFVRTGTATALTPSCILLVDKARMLQMLHKRPTMSGRFITHLLARNKRLEDDLLDQLCHSSEKRLARALLLLARDGQDDEPVHVVPRISQETLAELIGTTRSRVNGFLNHFRELGLIEYCATGPYTVKGSLNVVLND